MTARQSLTSALRSIAGEYQSEAERHNLVTDADALERAACTIRLAAVLVRDRIYDLDTGYAWLEAAGDILTRIQDAHIRSNA